MINPKLEGQGVCHGKLPIAKDKGCVFVMMKPYIKGIPRCIYKHIHLLACIIASIYHMNHG